MPAWSRPSCPSSCPSDGSRVPDKHQAKLAAHSRQLGPWRNVPTGAQPDGDHACVRVPRADRLHVEVGVATVIYEARGAPLVACAQHVPAHGREATAAMQQMARILLNDSALI